VSCAEAAEPIDLPFGLWTRVGRMKHTFNRIRQVAPMCPHGIAHNHWRHHPVLGGDTVLCQITLTACLLIAYIGVIMNGLVKTFCHGAVISYVIPFTYVFIATLPLYGENELSITVKTSCIMLFIHGRLIQL